MKLGADYIPITNELPDGRLNCILEDANANVLVTDLASQDWVNRLAGPKDTVGLDDETLKQTCQNLSGDNLATIGIDADTIAHIIYTSGSTGRPKGVLGTHGATFNRVTWMHQRFEYGEGEQAAHLTSMAFIRSVWELFVPLCSGLPMTLIQRDVVKDISRLMALLEQQKITRIVTAPSLMRAILQHYQLLNQQGESIQLTRLRYWFVSGEALPTDLAKEAMAVFANVEFYNLYGSTEVLSDVLYTQVTGQEQSSFIPLGKPISQVAVTVVDRQGNPVPDGVLGELVVTGKSVVAGYDGLAALNKTQFIDTPAGRGYRTGDLARVMPDGQIGYVGRADFQLKIRGYRIELGEIETRLLQIDKVNSVVVVAHEYEPQQKRLVAYLTLDKTSQKPSCERALIRAFRESLQANLPDYMVPSFFVLLDELPLTPNGKINRKALPEPQDRVMDSEYVAPQNAVEAKLVGIWADLLHIESDKLSVTANFIELGGHSLLLTRMLHIIKEQFDSQLSVKNLLEGPTVRQIAGLLIQHQQTGNKGAQNVPMRHFDEPQPQWPLSYAQYRVWFVEQLKDQTNAHI
ncbi:MAG: AMP-binding protein, partial [Psychrosphaera sp.]|nr:AMP-binding protein [Psychrosphaera sp.]